MIYNYAIKSYQGEIHTALLPPFNMTDISCDGQKRAPEALGILHEFNHCDLCENIGIQNVHKKTDYVFTVVTQAVLDTVGRCITLN